MAKKKLLTLKQQNKLSSDNAFMDISEMGPLTYRLLQRANNLGEEEPLAYLTLDLAQGAIQDMYMGATAPRYTETPSGLGESTYDEGLVGEFEYENINEYRALRLSGVAKLAAGTLKGGILTGTTFLDGTLGLVYGTGAAINLGRWSALWDNDFSKAMQAVNDWSEKAMPNYYTRDELESPWYTNIFTANFIGDKFIKNLGFTIGALYSGGVLSAMIKGAGRLLMAGAKNLKAGYNTLKNISNATSVVAAGVGAFTSALNEGRIEALNNSREWYNTNKELIDLHFAQRLKELEAYKGSSDYDTLVAEELKKYEETLAKLNEDRLHMGNADLLMNLPILTASNLIQFGRLYARGFSSARKARMVEDRIGGSIKGKIKNGKADFKAATTKKKIYGKAAVSGLSEGFEEMSQAAASRASGFHYTTDLDNFQKSLDDPQAKQELLDWFKSIMEGINDSVNDGSVWEEGFIGALTGWLGLPSFSRTKNGETGKKKLTLNWNGGIYGEVKHGFQRMARELEVADQLNKRVNSEEFLNYYKGLIRHRKFLNDMDKAAELDDKFEFENAKHNLLISDIVMFDNAGKLAELEEFIHEGLDDKSLENIDNIIKNTSKVIDRNKSARLHLEGLLEADREEIEGYKRLLADIEERDDLDKDSKEIITSHLNDKIVVMERTLKDEEEILNNLSSKEEPIYIGPYTDENGNPLSHEEISLKMDETKKLILDTIDNYKKIKAEYDEVGRGLLNKELEAEIIWMTATEENLNQRKEELGRTLKPTLRKLMDFYLSAIDEILGITDTHTLSKEEEDDLKKKKELFTKSIDILKNISSLSNSELGNLGNSGTKELAEGIIKNVDNLDSITALEKEKVKKDILDLIKIALTREAFHNKTTEYLLNPLLLLIHHQNLDEQKLKLEETLAKNNIASKLKWDGTSLDLVNSIKANMPDIEAVGGLDEFIKSLTPELKAKMKSAKSLMKGTETAHSVVDLSELSDVEKLILLEIIDEGNFNSILELSSFLGSMVDNGEIKLKIAETLKEQNPDITETNLLKAAQEGEEKIWKLINEEFSKIEGFVKNLEDIEDTRAEEKRLAASSESIKELEEQLAHKAGTESILESSEGKPIIKDLEEKNAVGESLLEDLMDKKGIGSKLQDENEKAGNAPKEDDKSQQLLPQTSEDDVKNHKIKSPSLASPLYVSRPWLSQFYLKGLDLLTYLDLLEENPEYLPDGVDKEAFKKYLKATLEYLNKYKAFEYVSGIDPNNRLSKGEKIYFLIDDELTKAAGTEMGVIAIKDNNGFRPIGVTASKLALLSKPRYYNPKTGKIETSNKTIGENNPTQVALLEEILNRDKQKKELLSSKVTELMAGSLPISSKESSISEVFKDETPFIAIYNPNSGKLTTGNSKIDDKIWLGENMSAWQVYVLIPSNKGIYLPALCYSTKLSDLVSNKDDWYIKNITEALNNLTSSLDTTDSIKALRRWINLPGLNASIGRMENKKWVKETSDVAADGNKLRISYKIGDAWLYYTFSLEDGKITQRDIDKFLNKIAKEGFTTNVDMSKLGTSKEDIEYRKNIARYLHSNLVRGHAHTINDWFIYKPTEPEILKKSLAPEKKITLKPTQEKTVTFESKNYTIKDSKVEDADGNLVSLELANKILDSDRLGVQILETQTLNLGDDNSNNSKDDLVAKNIAAMLIGGNSGAKTILGQFAGRPKGLGRRMEVDSVLNEEITPLSIKDKAILKLKLMFPKLGELDRVVIVEGIIHTIDEQGNPVEAYGLFRDGVLYLSNQAPKGTAYHEAFHYVTDFLLNNKEKERLFSEAKRRYGDLSNIALEEKLAEDFRKYMNDITAPTVSGFFRRIFNKLKHILRSLSSNPNYIDSVFYEAYTNSMSNRRELKLVGKDVLHFKDELLLYKALKLRYDNLDDTTKEYLKLKNVSKEDYDDLSTKDKEVFLQCLI